MKQRSWLPTLVCLILFASTVPAAVQISEFMTANKGTIQDEDGDYSDWIELFNPGIPRVDLTGWALTDDPTNLYKWRFPKTMLLTNEYLIVFASAKNRTNSAAPLHANFKLARE